MKWATLPRRLRVGLTGFATLFAIVLIGPPLLGPAPTADAEHAALVPPLTALVDLELTDGRRLVTPLLVETAETLILEGGHARTEVRRDQVATRTARRAWLGTDRYGRDVLRLMLVGGRISIAIAGVGALIALLVGGAVGIAAATGGRLADGVLMRLVDALLAFPSLLLLILAASVLNPGAWTLILVLGLTSWMGLARLVRGQVLSIRERPFVLAARVSGTPWYRVWWWHYLPEVRGPVAQDAALRLGDLVLAEATLSYLGLGLPPTSPTWGRLVSEGHGVMLEGWWLATVPGLAIALLVIFCALIGDGLQGPSSEF